MITKFTITVECPATGEDIQFDIQRTKDYPIVRCYDNMNMTSNNIFFQVSLDNNTNTFYKVSALEMIFFCDDFIGDCLQVMKRKTEIQ